MYWSPGIGFRSRNHFLHSANWGESTLRIDHPSDLLCKDGFRAESPRLSAQTFGDSGESTAPTDGAANTAQNYKEQGNAALRKQDILLAHAKYTQGLKMVKTGDAVSND
jgi:hypothetical protein